MPLCFIDCMFGWSFALLCDDCGHFHIDCFVFDQVVHMFRNIFICSHFICYIILVLLLLALPWGSNVFCASVLDYKYTCSMFITASRFRCEWVLSLFPNSHFSLESILGCFVTKQPKGEIIPCHLLTSLHCHLYQHLFLWSFLLNHTSRLSPCKILFFLGYIFKFPTWWDLRLFSFLWP